ncbi:MAG TPA: Lrp/AsnC family transcriptional regulator [Deltaproteobacteria bacterium]|nr:Lrp/AsnC family transcriptional regulator [Deltaproteobacteria bacterium]
MSVEAYVFVECEHGKSTKVAETITKIGGVKSAKTVTGPYDVIVLVEASSFRVLADVVMKKIQAIEGVKRTLTNIVVE